MSVLDRLPKMQSEYKNFNANYTSAKVLTVAHRGHLYTIAMYNKESTAQRFVFLNGSAGTALLPEIEVQADTTTIITGLDGSIVTDDDVYCTPQGAFSAGAEVVIGAMVE